MKITSKKPAQRRITKIIIHCSATPEGQHFTVHDIDRWHRLRGFNCIGYHYVVHLDGTIATGRSISTIGAHCKGHNVDSIGICYIGGCDANMKPLDTRTPQQRNALRQLVEMLLEKYPEATVHGHREFAAKSCPSFDVGAELDRKRRHWIMADNL